MFDIKWIRSNPDLFDKALSKRGLLPVSADLLAQDEKVRSLQTRIQAIAQSRNECAHDLQEAKKQGTDVASFIQHGGNLKQEQQALEASLREATDSLEKYLSLLPNLPLDQVPGGLSEEQNVFVHSWGDKPSLSFDPQTHYDLGEGLGLMDFAQAATVSGSRFVILKGALARLERALAQFMLDMHTQEYGYTEMSVPFLVKSHSLYGTGNLPKFSEDLFKTSDDLWLIPTAEVPLTNLVAGKILSQEELPLRYTAYTPCFRSEAGSAGKDTRGMMRLHQFGKVELVSITTPDASMDEHERMTAVAEEVLKRLKLPFRRMLLCAGDTGPASQKTYDLEVWLPSQNLYREIASCSQCGAYQARRMNARFRPREAGDKKTDFVHTLNGTGLALGRTLIALLENHQNQDGSITIPASLSPYLSHAKRINKDGSFC